MTDETKETTSDGISAVLRDIVSNPMLRGIITAVEPTVLDRADKALEDFDTEMAPQRAFEVSVALGVMCQPEGAETEDEAVQLARDAFSTDRIAERLRLALLGTVWFLDDGWRVSQFQAHEVE